MSLIEATRNGNKEVDKVLQLIRIGVDVNKKNNCGISYLHRAAQRGHYDMCKALLENGAKVNTVDNDGMSPLMQATYYNHINVVCLLLHNGASLEVKDNEKQRPVDRAKEWELPQIVDVIEKEFPLWLRLYHAARQGNYNECVALLEQNSLHETSYDGLYCPMTAATKKGHKRIVKLLLEKGAKVNYEDNDERNSLYLATKKGHTEIVTLLLKKGFNANVKVNGDTLLHVATRKDDKKMVLLLQNGLNPNLINKEGFTPLHYAIINRNGDIANKLIQHSANIKLTTNKLDTPLHLACEVGHQQIVEILLKNGANTDALNEESNKPMDILNRKCFDKIKALLIPPQATPVAQGATSEGRLEVNKHDNSHDDSNSDVTVEYPLSTMGSMKRELCSRILDTTATKELNTKMAGLSALVLEFNEKTVNLEITENKLALETNTVTYLNRKMEHTRVLKQLSKDLKSQLAYEEAMQRLARRVDESKRKELELVVERQKFQTEIPPLKTNLKNVFREITRILNKIDIFCICL